MSDLVVAIMIALLIGYALEELGIGIIIILIVGFFIGPSIIENTNNSCQAVKVITYRHQHSTDIAQSAIPTEVWTQLMNDGNQMYNQTGAVRCSDMYWRIQANK